VTAFSPMHALRHDNYRAVVFSNLIPCADEGSGRLTGNFGSYPRKLAFSPDSRPIARKPINECVGLISPTINSNSAKLSRTQRFGGRMLAG
jgi:hypothetical protein